MPGNLERAINRDFSAGLVEQFRRALAMGYRYACATHLDEAGSNDATFGFNLYWFNLHQLTQVSKGGHSGFRVTSVRPEFRMSVGQFNVACHRVGSEANEPISHCFPRNPNGPGKLAAQNAIQLCLELPAENDPSVPGNVILAHMGNPSDGLQAMYVAVPSSTSNGGHVNAWRFTKLLWKAPNLAVVPDVPAPVTLSPPTLTFREEVATGDTSA